MNMSIDGIKVTEFCFRFEADSSDLSDKKPILDEVFCFHLEQNRRGANVKSLLKLTVEIIIKSVENHELVNFHAILV